MTRAAMTTPDVVVIEPRSHGRLLDFRELWSYRELLVMLAARDVRVRYKHTILGAAWAVVRPVLSMLIFSVVFGRLAKLPSGGVPYPVFVLAGLLPWMFFAQAVSSASASVIGASSLITRVYFPRRIVPIASIGVAIVDFLIAMLLMVSLMAWYGIAPAATALWLPLLIGLTILIALGFGIAFSCVSVLYRDFRHVEPFLMQIWMFATPVVFPVTLIPEPWRVLAYLNPMTGMVESFRAAWTGQPIDWSHVALSGVLGMVVLAIGLFHFARVERRFADMI